MLALVLLVPLSQHALITNKVSLMQRISTARLFTISYYLGNDDKTERDHPHRTPAAVDSVSAIYDVANKQLTIYSNYNSHCTAAYIFSNDLLVLGGSRVETAVGDSLCFDLNWLCEGAYLVVVENQDNGMLFYSYIPDDPRFQARSTFEFASHKYYTNNTPTDSLPPLGYSATIACDVYPTFYKDIVTAGGTLHVGAESADANCQVFLFSKDNPAAFSQTFTTQVATGDSISRGSMSYTVPAGTYLLVVSADTDCSYKKCNVTVNDTTYTNQWLAYNHFDFTINPENSQTVYDSFVRGWHCNPQLLLLGGNNAVVAYQGCQQTAYTNGWSDNIHICRSYSAPTTGALIIPTGEVAPPPLPYLYHPVRLASLYVGCKRVKNSDRSISKFKTDYRDSVFYASDATVDCDSWSWAAGEWMVADNPLRVLAQDYVNDSVDNVVRFDSLFARVGFTRDNATYTNSSIDLHYLAGSTSYKWHAAVKAYSQKYAMGYGWESKMNAKGNRFFHPRQAIATDNSATTYYYRRYSLNEAINTSVPPKGFITFNPGELIYENEEELDDEYYDWIWEKIDEGASLGACIDFDYYYYYAERVMESDTLSSFEAFTQSAEYNTLLNYCVAHPELMYYAFLTALEGDETGVTLIEDLYAHAYPTVLQQVWTYNRTHKRSGDNKGLRRTRHANAVLFIRTLLDAEMSANGRHIAQRHVNYSDDPTVLNVSADNNSLTIGFTLKTDANVSLSVSTPNGESVARPISMQRMYTGDYSRHVDLQRSGVYIVTMRENGRIYSRKVIIK